MSRLGITAKSIRYGVRGRRGGPIVRRVWAFVLAVGLATPALANPHITFEPDEEDDHGVNMKRAIVNIETVTITRDATSTKPDATPGQCSTDSGCTAGGMVTAIAIVDGNECPDCVIQYTIDADAGGTDRDGNNYQIHIRGRDANGKKITYNGGLRIRSESIDF